MVGQTPEIYLEVAPRGVELVGPRGLRLSAALEPAEGEAGPRIDAEGFARVLRQWAEEHGLKGRRAALVFDSPTSVSGTLSYPRSIGEAAAVEAALTGSEEWVEPTREWARAAVVAASDARGEDAKLHVVATCEDEATVRGLCAAVEEAGLRLAWSASATAVLLVRAQRRALELSAQGSAVVLEVGPTGSALCAAEDGRIALTREAGIGAESLIDALEHAPALEGRDREALRAGLFAAGVPVLGEGQRPDDRTRATLAALQPVLQRWAVELRQTNRFGFSGGSRASALLAVEGFGPAIPGLAEYLAEHAGLTLLTEEPRRVTEGAPMPSNATHGPLARLREGGIAPRVLPAPIRHRRRRARLRRAIWCGAGLALVLLGLDLRSTHLGIAEARASVGGMRAQEGGADHARAVAERVAALDEVVRLADLRLETTLGSPTRLGATARGVAQATPAHVRLEHLSLLRESGRAVASLTGSIAGSPDEAGELLRQYVRALEALPVVERVALGPTLRGQGEGSAALSFSLEATLVELPTEVAR